MAKYAVDVRISGTISYIVEADNVSEAKQRALDMYKNNEPEIDADEYIDTLDVGTVTKMRGDL